MTSRRVIAASAVAALALAGPALAGTVTRTDTAITYQAGPPAVAADRVELGVALGLIFVASSRGAGTTTCLATEENRADCAPVPLIVVNLVEFDDILITDLLTGPFAVEAHGGAGADRLSGADAGDRLLGETGNDTLDGRGGSDVLDGGPGNDTLSDGAGADAVAGGPGDDAWTAGAGADQFTGGDGVDIADYRGRTATVLVFLDDLANDGESGEGDLVGFDVEEVLTGSGADRLVAGTSASGYRLRGGAGNDELVGGPGPDRLEGDEGDDTIDSRGGGIDQVDCGAGTDTVLADPGDSVVGCEVLPDRDGDGTSNDTDCAPDDPAVHPGAKEVAGNAVDEDCAGGPLYLQVPGALRASVTPVRLPPKGTRPPRGARFSTLRLVGLRPGTGIEVRCTGEGCPFRLARSVVPTGRTQVDLLPRLKRRVLLPFGQVEVRLTQPSAIGRVFRTRVTERAGVRTTTLCLPPGARAPGRCL